MVLSADIVMDLFGNFNGKEELKELKKIEKESKENTMKFERSIKKLSSLL